MRAITNLTVLAINYIIYNFYLYELFYGSWDKAEVKGLFYLVTGSVLFYFIIDMMRGWASILHYHTTLVYLFSLVITFWLFASLLTNSLHNGIFCLLLYNGLMTTLTITILINGKIYGQFKQ